MLDVWQSFVCSRCQVQLLYMANTMNTLDNPKAERIRHIADLAHAKARKKTGHFLIEGPQSVREAVAYARNAISDMYVDGSYKESQVLSHIVNDALSADVYIHTATTDVMNHISANNQGIAAVASMDSLIVSLEDIRGHESMNLAAFWQIRDPGNAGTVIRSADAAGCDAVLFVDDCVDPFNPKVIRSTAGSLFHIPVIRVSTYEFFAWCASQDIDIVAADVYGTPERRPQTLPDLLAQTSYRGTSKALLFGNEARGLPCDVLKRVQRIVSIPLYGKAESLNLATSAAVVLYSFAMSSHIGRM